jgi:hypothetical protein
MPPACLAGGFFVEEEKKGFVAVIIGLFIGPVNARQKAVS